MAISWLNQDQMAGVAPGWTGPPGKCLVRHITPQYIGENDLGPFLSFPGTYPGARFLLRLLLLKNIDFQDVYYIILLIQVLLAKLRNISMVCPLWTELKSELLTTLKCQYIL